MTRYLLDTDTLTYLLLGHPRVREKCAEVTAEVVLTVITRIEVLQGRFAAVLTAEDGERLLRSPKVATCRAHLHG